MKRVLLAVAVTLVIPSILIAEPTVGVYFEDMELAYTPAVTTPFYAALYIQQTEEPIVQITAIEYSLELSKDGVPIAPGDPLIVAIDPDGWPWEYSIDYGDIWGGHAITYFPPLSPDSQGFDLLATYEMVLLQDCTAAGEITVTVKEDPRSGYLRGTYYPDADKIYCVGLSSLVCPAEVGTKEESWGAIKSMYR
jgi:hypothetical protein